MCLIFISIHDHPTYKLVVAANRDEFYKRKTAAAEFWQDQPEILGGRDLEAGGTWLGMTRSGRISMLTNFRDLRNLKTNAPSRGHLVSDFLLSSKTPEEYLKSIQAKANVYNGFNLLAGTTEEMWFYSNYGDKTSRADQGIHGLSNHLLNTPWPKVRNGKEKFRTLLKRPVLHPDELFEFMYDDRVAPVDQLPDTGVGPELELALSSMFIKTANYGSRSSTVVLIDKRNHVLFSERVYDLRTFDHTTSNFEFDIAR